MKKKLDVKLTACLVSLFIGFILMILGNKNRYCLSFGLIFLGAGVALYAFYKKGNLNQLLSQVDEEIEELDVTDEEQLAVLAELNRIRTKTIRQRRTLSICFNLFAVLLVVMGILAFA